MTFLISTLAFGLISGSTKTSTKPVVKSFRYYGDITPTGFFDPLNLSNEKNSKYLREFELQHSRIAMLAAVALPVLEMTNPGTLSINALSQMDVNAQSPFWGAMALIEYYRMLNGWDNPFTPNGTLFTLKEDFQPGNYFKIDSDKVSERLYNCELSNGRLAMLAVAHIVGSELLTGKPLF